MMIECDQSVLGSNAVRVLCDYLCKTMNVPATALEKLVLVSEAGFGSAVHTLQAQAASAQGYTNNSFYTAVGKTIPRKLSDGTVVSTIVCRQELVQAVFIGIESKKHIAEWHPVSQQGWYVLHHEFGHALDNFLRSDASDSGATMSTLQQIGEHYTGLLLSEFAASFHSGHAMSAEVYNDEIRSTAETLTKMLVEIEDKKRHFSPASSPLFPLAATVSQTMWLTLAQYAKVFGSRTSNEVLRAGELVYWEGANPRSIAVLESFRGELEAIRELYPNWTANVDSQLFACWDELCLANGYTFEFWPTGEEEFYFIPTT